MTNYFENTVLEIDPGSVWKHRRTGELVKVVDFDGQAMHVTLERPDGGGLTSIPGRTLETLYDEQPGPESFGDRFPERPAAPKRKGVEPGPMDKKFVNRGRFNPPRRDPIGHRRSNAGRPRKAVTV